jgi:hypothetical protein
MNFRQRFHREELARKSAALLVPKQTFKTVAGEGPFTVFAVEGKTVFVEEGARAIAATDVDFKTVAEPK